MPLSDVFEKLGRAIFESPFNAPGIARETPELAEIRLRALEFVKKNSHSVAGKLVFPFNLLRIHLSGVTEKEAAALQGEFLANYFESELKDGLARAGCRFPADLHVAVETTPEVPGAKQDWVRMEAESVASEAAPEAKPIRYGSLTVVEGDAGSAVIALEKSRSNIGRVVDVYTNAGPSRRNDVAFSADTEINRSVSREHAHIARDSATGEYRIFNDRHYKLGPGTEANCGLWIVRGGLSQPVHRNSRGVALQDGDEIHLGRAVLQFQAAEPG